MLGNEVNREERYETLVEIKLPIPSLGGRGYATIYCCSNHWHQEHSMSNLADQSTRSFEAIRNLFETRTLSRLREWMHHGPLGAQIQHLILIWEVNACGSNGMQYFANRNPARTSQLRVSRPEFVAQQETKSCSLNSCFRRVHFKTAKQFGNIPYD